MNILKMWIPRLIKCKPSDIIQRIPAQAGIAQRSFARPLSCGGSPALDVAQVLLQRGSLLADSLLHVAFSCAGISRDVTPENQSSSCACVTQHVYSSESHVG